MGYKRCPQEGHLMDSSWKYCPICIAPLAGWLVVESEKGKAHRSFTLHEGTSFVGSGDDCEIQIKDLGLLRQQLQIVIRDTSCTVIDLSPDNTMQINNESMSRKDIIDGDLISLGDVKFRVKLLNSN